ncbi:uncharacterized protein PF3D7_1120000-like [Sabethes cyaneus]|uniref:uncharacterized protein PF3D7_1120000-like n=1 Tax=Sabethes cyaneus TaxID=53552 RepID=UPI00237D74A2|nr:uncharacterized protein PF3D7_1120000-like [Sabethes cyaneus]
MDTVDKLIDFLQREKVPDDPSYEEQLERQKRLLLKQREVDDFRRIANDTKNFDRQLKKISHNVLTEARKTQILCHKLDDLKIEIQGIIDQNLIHMMDAICKQELTKSFKDTERERKRQEINEFIQQIGTFQQIRCQIQESKGQKMLLEAKEQEEQEYQKLEEVRSEINNIFKARREAEEAEWKKITTAFVEISQLYMHIITREKEKETLLQNNIIMRTKIEHLKEEIKQQIVREEEELKQQEIEMNERFLTPIKISHADVSQDAFKNPNDFPALVERIELTRRTYENIFKRAEYVQPMKSKKTCRKMFKISMSVPKKTPIVQIRQLSNENYFHKSQLYNNIHTTDQKASTENLTSSASGNKTQVISKAKTQTGILINKIKPVKRKIPEFYEVQPSTGFGPDEQKETKRLKHSRTQPEQTKNDTPIIRKRTRSNSIQKEQTEVHRIQSRKESMREAHSNTQPELTDATNRNCQQAYLKSTQKLKTVKEISGKSVEHSEKVQKSSKSFEQDLFFNTGKTSENVKERSKESLPQNTEVALPDDIMRSEEEAMDFETEGEVPQEESVTMQFENERQVATDNTPEGNFENVHLRDEHGFDVHSLTSSTSSLDLEDPGSSSDFDLDFSLNGSPVGCRNGSGGKKSTGSDGSELDFDFLNSPKSRSEATNRSQQQSGFEFDFSNNGNDGGFDFF